jgi:AraC-like DNA-binding protein
MEDAAREYRKATGCALLHVDPDGALVLGRSPCPGCARSADCRAVRKRAVAEALRWGEPSVHACPDERLIWGVPLMRNEEVTGGLVAVGPRLSTGPTRSGAVRKACRALLDLAERRNLTNAARLALRREETERERMRAMALHSLKDGWYDSIRAIYLREEPGLLAAIKGGERRAAREIINRVLVGIYHLGRNRLELVKSFVLELVVMMCRTAVEAGGEPAELLGANYESLSAVASIHDEEALCHWLTEMLERLMDGIRDNRKYPNTALLENGLRYMEKRLHEEVGRDDAAKAACLSPSHFSRLLKEQTGKTFTELLNDFRVNKARELLARTDQPILAIALDCGFCDQSWFTKAFRRATGLTPREYRERHAASSPSTRPVS